MAYYIHFIQISVLEYRGRQHNSYTRITFITGISVHSYPSWAAGRGLFMGGPPTERASEKWRGNEARDISASAPRELNEAGRYLLGKLISILMTVHAMTRVVSRR